MANAPSSVALSYFAHYLGLAPATTVAADRDATAATVRPANAAHYRPANLAGVPATALPSGAYPPPDAPRVNRLMLGRAALPPTRFLSTSAAESDAEWFDWRVPASACDAARSATGNHGLLLYSQPVSAGTSGIVYVGRHYTYADDDADVRRDDAIDRVRGARVVTGERRRTSLEKMHARWVAVKVFIGRCGAHDAFVREVAALAVVNSMIERAECANYATMRDWFVLRTDDDGAALADVAFDRFYVDAAPDSTSARDKLVLKRTRVAASSSSVALRYYGLHAGVIVLDFGEVAASLFQMIPPSLPAPAYAPRSAAYQAGAAESDAYHTSAWQLVARGVARVGAADGRLPFGAPNEYAAGVTAADGARLPQTRMRFERGHPLFNRVAVDHTRPPAYGRAASLSSGFDYVACAFQVMYAIGAMHHARGLLHGDIKPDNIVLREVPDRWKAADVLFHVSPALVFAVPFAQRVGSAGAARRLGHVMSMGVAPLVIDFTASRHITVRADAERPITTVTMRPVEWSFMLVERDRRHAYVRADDVFAVGMTLLLFFVRAGDSRIGLFAQLVGERARAGVAYDHLVKAVRAVLLAWHADGGIADEAAKAAWLATMRDHVGFVFDAAGDASKLDGIIAGVASVIVLMHAMAPRPPTAATVLPSFYDRTDATHAAAADVLVYMRHVRVLRARLVHALTPAKRAWSLAAATAEIHASINRTLQAGVEYMVPVAGTHAYTLGTPTVAAALSLIRRNARIPLQVTDDPCWLTSTYVARLMTMLGDMLHPDASARPSMLAVFERHGAHVFEALSIDVDAYRHVSLQQRMWPVEFGARTPWVENVAVHSSSSSSSSADMHTKR